MKALGITAILLAAVGCVPTREASLRQLGSRATFDLGCPVDHLRIVELDETTTGAEGCGRRATYLRLCGGFGSCMWIQQGASRSVP